MTNSARWLFAALLACAFAGALATQAPAQIVPMAAPTAHIQVQALPSPGVVNFDPHKSVDAYLSRIGGKAKARSDAYFEGGYVLSVVDVLYTIVVAGLLLWFRISARMRNVAVRMTRYRFLQVPIYVVQYVVVTTLAGLPLAIYEGFVREHAYGLSNQTFLQWTGDFGIQFGVSIVAFTILLAIIYAAARAAKGRWWVWGTGLTVAFMVVMLVISPVYIAPLFNHYTQLPESGMRHAIQSMARANGIPADNINAFDA